MTIDKNKIINYLNVLRNFYLDDIINVRQDYSLTDSSADKALLEKLNFKVQDITDLINELNAKVS